METDLTDYQGAHELTGLKLGTLRSMVARHQIPHVRVSPRIVMFSRRELLRWLEKKAVDVAERPVLDRASGDR